MLKMINENHNERILNYILHGKINVGRPIKNILYWLRETQWVTLQILKDMDNDDAMYLTSENYTKEN